MGSFLRLPDTRGGPFWVKFRAEIAEGSKYRLHSKNNVIRCWFVIIYLKNRQNINLEQQWICYFPNFTQASSLERATPTAHTNWNCHIFFLAQKNEPDNLPKIGHLAGNRPPGNWYRDTYVLRRRQWHQKIGNCSIELINPLSSHVLVALNLASITIRPFRELQAYI